MAVNRRREKRGKPFNLKKNTAMALVGVVLLCLLAAALVAVPGLEGALFQLLGITPANLVPVMEYQHPTGVHFIDVGQGDAVLLEESGEFALIDAGPPEGKDTLLAYLKQAGVERLRYVAMTHPHADHIGGMQAVLENFPVDMVLLPDLQKAAYPTTSTFLKLLEKMVQLGLPAETMQLGNQYGLGTGNVTVVHDGVLTGDNYNLISTALMFEANGLRYLSTGDGEKANEAAMLESDFDLHANLFKAGHHGSHTSNTYGLLSQVEPQIVVVTCAAGNSYGHPHREPLKTFEEVGAVLLRQDRDSCVLVRPLEDGTLVYATRNNAVVLQPAA